jgi:predicted unusual protein kinase regulating ubiquinone biosynthesis (AarF/ABC1/UbiB family)
LCLITYYSIMSGSLQTFALIESIQKQVWQVQQNRRKEIASDAMIANVLDELDIIINRSYDQHTTIGVETLTVETEDDGLKATYYDMQTAKRIAADWLIRLISAGDMSDELTDRAAHVLAHFSGRGGKRRKTRDFYAV